MPTPTITIRIPQEISDLIEKEAIAFNENKTAVVLKIIKQYFGLNDDQSNTNTQPPSVSYQTITDNRLDELEKTIKHLQQLLGVGVLQPDLQVSDGVDDDVDVLQPDLQVSNSVEDDIDVLQPDLQVSNSVDDDIDVLQSDLQVSNSVEDDIDVLQSDLQVSNSVDQRDSDLERIKKGLPWQPISGAEMARRLGISQPSLIKWRKLSIEEQKKRTWARDSQDTSWYWCDREKKWVPSW